MMHVPHPISWADEERDLTAWLGNDLQDDAFDKLYSIREKIKLVTDENILRDWKYLQTSDHFYYMCTKWFSDGDVHKYFNPYDSPYDAFINFMNALSDFMLRVDEHLNQQNLKQFLPEEINKKISEYEQKINELKGISEEKPTDRTKVKAASAKKKVATQKKSTKKPTAKKAASKEEKTVKKATVKNTTKTVKKTTKAKVTSKNTAKKTNIKTKKQG
jgi:alpha-amylase